MGGLGGGGGGRFRTLSKHTAPFSFFCLDFLLKYDVKEETHEKQDNDKKMKRGVSSPDGLDVLTLLLTEKQLPWQPLSHSGTGLPGRAGESLCVCCSWPGLPLAPRHPVLRGNPTED